MAFHEVRFPDNINYGSAGGPGHNTTIIALSDSGFEERTARWEGIKHTLNAAYNIKEFADLAILKAFVIARRGATHGFRYKDWNDFTTKADGTSAYGDDANIGVGDAATTDFQLVKKYTSGGITRTRNLRKPVAGKVKVYKDGVEQFAGWTVNTATGIVTFVVAPAIGVVISAGCEFDIPVRCSDTVDKLLSIQIDNFSSGSVPDLELTEMFDGETIADEFYYGGSGTVDPMAADVTWVPVNGRFMLYNPQSAALKVKLPAAAVGGAPHAYFKNTNGGNNLTVTKSDGVTVVGTILPGITGELLYDATGASWHMR